MTVTAVRDEATGGHVDYPVEILAPDIAPHRLGNSKAEYVHTFSGDSSGPHACINALMHGNELCGAIVVDRLLREGLRPTRGKLTFCFVNVAAFHSFDPKAPQLSRFVHEDMNRVWVEHRLDGSESNVELDRARSLRPLFDDVDYLLDIHSMSTLSEPILLCNGLAKERELAGKMGFPRAVACGSGHIEGRRLIEYSPFHDPSNHKTALLIECGQHWNANTVPVAMDTALYFLKALDMLPESFDEKHLTCRVPRSQWMLDVTDGYTTKTNAFRFVEPYVGLEVFEKAGTVIAIDGDEEVRTPYDECVLVMPHHTSEMNRRVLRFARRHQ